MKTKTTSILIFLTFQPLFKIAYGQPAQFTEVAQVSGLWNSGTPEVLNRALQATWVDYDHDEDLDLFYTDGLKNFLFQNQGGGTFANVIVGTGLEDSSNIYLGSTWGDFNNDALIDVFFKTEMSFPQLLYQNTGQGYFQDITPASGLQIEGGVMDASWMDYNGDGFIDLFVSNLVAQTLVYRSNGDGTFANVTPGSGLEADSSRNVALSWSDYDQDGDMDLFLSHFHNDLQSGEIVSNFLFRNETVNNWLEVDLEPRNSTNAVGVRVLAYTQDKTLKRETTYGSIQAPQNANRLLIGLSLKSSLDSLVVVWPSGQQDKATSIGANRIVVAKEGEGIVTAVEEPAEGPKNFQLHQNYPNPFNPETTIEYELAQPGPVRLSIYNLLGQRLRTLVDEWQPAGSYRVRWSGSVEGGARSVASGVYVVELKVGEKVQRRKMLVIR